MCNECRGEIVLFETSLYLFCCQIDEKPHLACNAAGNAEQDGWRFGKACDKVANLGAVVAVNEAPDQSDRQLTCVGSLRSRALIATH